MLTGPVKHGTGTGVLGLLPETGVERCGDGVVAAWSTAILPVTHSCSAQALQLLPFVMYDAQHAVHTVQSLVGLHTLSSRAAVGVESFANPLTLVPVLVSALLSELVSVSLRFDHQFAG